MTSDLRHTGIAALGDVPWGSHLCLFYESGQDLVDTLVPYFKAGLEANEFCLCMVADDVVQQDVMRALGRGVPDFARYLANHAIEIVRSENLYYSAGVFDAGRATRYWHEKLEQALAAGFSGMRGNGNEALLERRYWPAFSEFERALGDAIGRSKMLVLCAYPLGRSGPGRLLDVAQAHRYVLAKRGKDWELLETTALRQTKQALEDELVEKEARYRSLFETSHDIVVFQDAAGSILDMNPRGVEVTGFTLDELRGMKVVRDLVVPADRDAIREVLERVRKSETQSYQVRWKTKDGRVVYFDGVSVARLSAAGEFVSTICSMRDVTARKRVERALSESEQQLKALSRRLVEVQETERRQLARELHDRVGQGLTALGINLDIVKSKVAGNGDSEVTSRLEDSIVLVEATADAIVNVLSELRPPMLDDLGLLPALEWYAEEFSMRTGIDVSVVGEDQVTRLPPEAEITLFRIAQEALNNVAKHARARHVDVELTANGEFLLSVSDDGVGFDAHSQPESRGSTRFGMVTMRERALAIGGRFDISQRPGGGTSVVVRIPSA